MDFLNITSQITQGVTGNLTRSLLIFSREEVTGFTPDPETGLYQINSTDLDAFETANPTSYALINNLQILFGQTYVYPYVYILSDPTGLTSALLNQANLNPRDWSFITIADRLQGSDSEDSSYVDLMSDIDTIATWNTETIGKILVHTLSLEETDSAITVPSDFLDNGEFRLLRIKTLISDDKTMLPGSIPVYHNVILAVLSFVINGIVLARSWGSFSDAFDFAIIDSDSYSSTVRSYIENNGLGQYNARRDRTGKKFFYNTLTNSEDIQIESLTSADYIKDYVYVYINNITTAAGFTGLTNDDAGIQLFVSLIRKALNDCFENGLILSKSNGTIDAKVAFLTAERVTAIDPSWQSTGVWITGMFVATIRPYACAHEIQLNFIF